MWIPATERAEPRKLASSATAKAITGRRTRSFTRLATNPTTPWCQLSSNRHTPLRCGAPGKRPCKHPPQFFYNDHNYVHVEVQPGLVKVCAKKPDGTPLEPCQATRLPRL